MRVIPSSAAARRIATLSAGRPGAVVDAGQNVRVQIDHQTAAYADRAAATRVHRSTLPAAAMRERRNEWL